MAFKDELKKYVDLAVGKSVVAFGKGKAAVSKFGDESATRIEKLQLEKKLNKEIYTFGKNVLQAFEEDKKETVSASDELLAASLRTIAELKAEIARKDELLKRDEKAESDASESKETPADTAADADDAAAEAAEEDAKKSKKNSEKNAKKDD
ncbi:MAG: hypothetical protein IJS09_03625 [Treponema sp.]|nr:hypothetical protein [Treponema sp.]